jgi:hypothetical protein
MAWLMDKALCQGPLWKRIITLSKGRWALFFLKFRLKMSS